MRSWLSIILFVFVWTAHAQQFSLRQYTAIDGLPQSQVNAILEDRYGYLWIGTSGGGLARFDGKEFKVYSTLDGLLSNVVTSLFIDSKQNIWAVHPRGLSRFDGMEFKRFQASTNNERLRRVRRLVEYHDTVFMVSTPGLIGKIHEDSVYYWSRKIFPNKSIFFTHVTADHRICYYLSDSSIVTPSPNGYRRFSHATVFGKVYNMFNHGPEVWLDTDKGMFALDLNTGSFARRAKVVDRYIVSYDPAEDVYWTRDERTLFREHLVSGKIVTDTVLKDVPIMQILLDAEGNTWLGSAGNGLYRHYARDFDRCGSDQLRGVMAIEVDKSGASWIGGRGLWRVYQGKISTYPLPNGDDDGVRTIKSAPDGAIWVGSFSGLGKFDPVKNRFTWFTREHGLSSAYITALDFDESGGIWIGTTGGGLNYRIGDKFQSIASQQALGSQNIASLRYLPALKTLFIGTEFGLAQLRNGAIDAIPVPEFENTTVLSLAAFRDSLLLVGSGGAGLAVVNPLNGMRRMVGPREGLPSGFVFFVAADEENRIWVGTEKGITLLELDSALEITETRHFSHDNGLTGIETNQNSYYLSRDKKYFGLIDGLYQFNGQQTRVLQSYPVHLTDVEIQYGQIPSRQFAKTLSGFFQIPESPVLPSDYNHITFHFDRVDKRYPGSVRYKYFLQNFDKTWSQPTANGHVTYGNLPPGEYVFMVLATNEQGSWEGEPLQYKLSIKEPFYRTAAFYTIVGGMLAGSLILFILVRLRRNVSRLIELEHIRQQEQESLRKEIARDFHDEMGNQLTRIINYVSLMRLTGTTGPGQDLYHKVEESAKYLYNGTRDFIWAIDPVNDDLSKLFLHIRDFGEKLFEEKNMQFRAYNEIKHKVRLPYGFSREVNLIFKEAMTNTFKHSGAQNVSLYLREFEQGFEMALEDDGAGFDPEKIKSSNGIKNIRSRAEKIESSLVLSKIDAGQGTRVQLRFTTFKKNAYDAGYQKTRADR